MRRTDLQGTALWAHQERIRRVRGMTPEERLRKTDELMVEMLALRRRLAKDRERPA